MTKISIRLILSHLMARPRMSVGYAEVLPFRPVKRDNKDKPQLIEPHCWGGGTRGRESISQKSPSRLDW